MIRLLLILFSCIGFAQKPVDSSLKKFDSLYFNTLKVDKNHISSPIDQFYIDGDNQVRVPVYKRINIVTVKTSLGDTPYMKIEKYNQDTGKMVEEGQSFSFFNYGRWKIYNSDGQLVEEIDHDKFFKFSVDQLIEKMKAEYKVDILNKELSYVNRTYRNKYKLSLFKVILKKFRNRNSSQRIC